MIENLVGRTLADRYHILELIGTGGMASVYRAQCELLKRDVAVKVLRENVKHDESARISFKQEAQAAAKISHNNIVQVFDVGESDGMDYMVMELVEGVTLKKYITERGALPWNEACDFAIQIAQALEAAHAKEFVHRDIKPQNILATEDKVLKVTDFGIAKATNAENFMAGGNDAIGSAHYISPEQARGGYTDARSDIYSLGIVLFEMLTGKVPFDGESAVSVALMHIEKQPPSVLEFNRNIPTDLAAIVAKAISKEQLGRYQSATEMIEDLHAVLENRHIEVAENYDDDESLDLTKRFNINETEIEKKKQKKVKRPKTPQEKKADRVATIWALITVAIIMLLGFGVWTYATHRPEPVIVPDFINMTREEAYRIAEERGLTLNELKTDVSDDVPKNCISWQDPTGGTEIDESEIIFIIVSEGPSQGNIPIPEVTGMSAEVAKQMIESKGLECILEEKSSVDVPVGFVISQSPTRDTTVSQGHKVTIFVSSGVPAAVEPQEISVPDMVGKTEADAKGVCEQYGLKLTTIQMDSQESAGTIIKQEPAAGTVVAKGSQITAIISTGQVSSPDAPADLGEQIKTKEFTYQIPEDPAGNQSVKVKITVDGDTEYERDSMRGDMISIDVSGTDRKKVVVFIDGRIEATEFVEFN